MFKRYFSLPLIIFSTILLSLFLCFPLLIICFMGSCSCSRRSSEREGGGELIHSFLGPAHIVELSSVLFLLPCFFLWDLGSGFCFLLLHLRSPFESLFCCCSFFKKKEERKEKRQFRKERRGWWLEEEERLRSHNHIHQRSSFPTFIIALRVHLHGVSICYLVLFSSFFQV